MISQGTGNPNDQPLYDRLWGSGFLPTTYQGVKFRSVGDPVLYLSNPPGVSTAARRRMLDDLARLNALKHRRGRRSGDPHADRPVRAGLPDADLGPRADRPLGRARVASSTVRPRGRASPGRIAANCLLARRLAERGVRFIQLFHRGWDQHTHLPKQIAGQCRDTDQASAALITRPQAARAARRDAGRLGRRVRPDGLLPGDADGRRLRPRPPSPLLHDLAGRRRHQARHHARRDRRLRLQHHRGSGPRPRPARHDPALPGHRPHPADLPVPGPPLPPDRRARRGDREDPGLRSVPGRIVGPAHRSGHGEVLWDLFPTGPSSAKRRPTSPATPRYSRGRVCGQPGGR